MTAVTIPTASTPAPAAPSSGLGGATRAGVRTTDLPTIVRLRDFMPTDRLGAWLLTAIVTAMAFAIRVYNLGYPDYLIFDETYYAKDAYSMMRFGVERQWPDPMDVTNKAFVAGDYSYLQAGPSFVVHPPLGKWLIGVGEAMFGVNSFGWRFMACVFGALLVGMTMRLARRVSRSTLVGVIAGLLLTFDGLAFTMSRIALLDIFQAFFVVAGVAAVVADRDWFRNRLADQLTALGASDLDGRFGRLALWRPWRWVAGLMFGCSIAVKWNSIYVLAAFGVLSVLWDVGARRLAGADFRSWLALLFDGVPAFIALVGTTVVTYVASWAGWFASPTDGHGGWARDWGFKNPTDPLVTTFGPDIAGWLHYHQEIYGFHTGDFINKATHVYNAHPAGWLLMIRPIGIDAVNDIKPGVDGCVTTSGNCLRVISGIGTPLLWWFAAIALVVAVVWWVAGRDWRFGVPVVAVAATWLPWVYQGVTTTRPLFFFYAITIVPFTVIGLAMVLGLILGKARSSGRLRGAIVAGLVVALVIVNFGFLYPVLTDVILPYNDWRLRMWLGSWI